MLKRIKIEELTPFDKNPRVNDQAVDRVLESLKFNGYVSPIVVNEIGHPFDQHVIAAGHTRWKALKKFGSTDIDVYVHKFESEKHFVRFNIEDNKAGEFAEWDEQMLADLGAEFDVDLVEMGFDIVQDSEDFGEEFSLPDGEKEPFQQMTFTLADAQAEAIKEALGLAKSLKVETHGNENSNGNALFAIVNQWAEQKT